VPPLATADALYATREDRPLQDILTCIRLGLTITEAGRALEANAERHLKSAADMADLYRDCPQAIAETTKLLDRIGFDLADLKYEYPHEPVPEGWEPLAWLRHLVDAAAAREWPNGRANRCPEDAGGGIRADRQPPGSALLFSDGA
jgi:error-prone DNA polymerase